MLNYDSVFANKQKILFVTAHPDDVDVFFGGLINLLTNDRKQVKVVVVTNGARGSRDNEIPEAELAKKRITEEATALSKLGVLAENFETLNYLDGEVENNFKLIGDIALIIREFKPEICCTHEPQGLYYPSPGSENFFVNHRDHRNVGTSVLDAVYPFARDRSFFPEHQKIGVTPHNVYELYFTPEFSCNCKIDMTLVADNKRRAMECHKSQFNPELIEKLLHRHSEGDKFFECGNYVKLDF